MTKKTRQRTGNFCFDSSDLRKQMKSTSGDISIKGFLYSGFIAIAVLVSLNVLF